MAVNLGDPVADLVTGHDFKLLIGGDLVDAADGATMETRNPSTGAVLTSVPCAGPEDVQRAYEAASRAQPAWEALGVQGRGEVFARFSQAIAEHGDRIAMLDAIDGGMPFGEMRIDMQISMGNLRDWPPLVRWHGGRTI